MGNCLRIEIEDRNGSYELEGLRYTFNNVKPNTYNPKKHEVILTSTEFYSWAKNIMKHKVFDSSQVLCLKGKPFPLWSNNAIVIPSFVLHILNPTVYPLYDQHVERAKRVLLSEEANKDATPLTISTYESYQAFFQEFIEENKGREDVINFQYIKQVDEALWSFGKFMKSYEFSKQPQQSSYGNTSSKTTFTPDKIFKERVFELIEKGLSQGKAIRMAAEERNVQLPKSYYQYPGSIIYSWRKQNN